jgi:hypothetical protein
MLRALSSLPQVTVITTTLRCPAISAAVATLSMRVQRRMTPDLPRWSNR